MGSKGKGLLVGLLSVVVLLVVMGAAIPVLWPVAANSTAINAMTGTDAGTTTIKSFWPIILLLVGLGLAVGLIVAALKKFGLLGGGFAFVPLLGVPIGWLLMVLIVAGIGVGIGLFISQTRKLKRFYATPSLV